MTELTFTEKIATVQNALIVPKTKNASVPYKSRNAEEILDTAKPLLLEQGLVITIDDVVLEIGGHIFIKSIATISDGDNTIYGTGIAELLPGNNMMNAAQASGATGSYARKYALGAVLAIGDGEDADHEKYIPQANSQPSQRVSTGLITDKQVGLINAKVQGLKVGNPEKHAEFGAWYKTGFDNKPFKALTKGEASQVIDRLMDKKEDDGELPPLEEYSGDNF